ncbi:DUF4230 domain-containing protein [Candidatus Stoquefichus sp. SB1]|jgi:hypothetical protein|uniref:DUF4230 domain-containing protein n=1 Tax=Candidatus Stoquefichus sp. SB1 TaxID=1658109 RepID=UPI00067F5108|nr:DUF4230 domain-containing protein [Candidatus Stoquefichus sp. SB1]
MAKDKKIHINQTFKNIIIIIVIAVVFFFVGKVWPSGEDPTVMTSDLLSQQIQSISELATVEYNYTNMGKFENQATFYGWKVPFTTKSFIISYDGKIKAGIDMSVVEVKISGKTIHVKVPQAKILSHEIDEKSIEVFDETKNIFNQISITDYNQFAIDQKDKMESNVKEKGLLKEAQEKAQSTIETFVKSLDLKDEYKIEITELQ